MKITATIRIDKSGSVSTKQFQELLSLAGRGSARPKALQAKYEIEDPNLKRLIAVARLCGLQIWSDHSRMCRDNEFRIWGDVTYDESDFQKCRYLHALPECEFMDCTTDNAKPPRVHLDTCSDNLAEMNPGTRKQLFAGNLQIALASLDYNIVSDAFKKEWETDDLRGGYFVDGFRCSGPNAKKINGKYWLFMPNKRIELSDQSSDLLREATRLIGDKAVAEEICRTNERVVLSGASVEKQQPFDVAQTVFVEDGEPKPGLLIGSHKFYDFCRRIGAAIEWQPVEISKKD